MKDSLSWTPMNRRAKCDVASFILGGEIRNHTNKVKQTNKQNHTHINSKRISTPFLSACVGKKLNEVWRYMLNK